MEALRFRVQNYKSIKDSGDCYLSRGITIFAGKNEAGKTSILEALDDFNVGKNISERAIPIGGDEDAKPSISVTFAISRDDIADTFSEIGIDLEKSLPGVVKVTFEKVYPNEYYMSDDTIEVLGLDDEESFEEIDDAINKNYVQLKRIHAAHSAQLQSIPLPTIDQGNYEAIKSGIEEYKTKTAPHLQNISESERGNFVKYLEEIIARCGEAVEEESEVERFLEEMAGRMPNFILFSSFNDVFPNIIPIPEIEKNDWIQDLELISDIDVKTIQSGTERNKAKHKNELNIKLNHDYKRFWEQDLANLSIDWNSQNLMFWIEEDGNYYEPEIRSQGKRWHLAFYIRVSARAREETSNVILIDEPGLYLHAKAQRDILKNLEDAVKADTQVIFSTHSPYLLETDKLERIRLVEKTGKRGTTIESKIHKVADKETLTPILTAIGLELSQGIAQLDRIHNVIVEGPSDYYYLNAFKKLANEDRLNFIFGGGAGNMPVVGTILQGWGCNIIYLYDNDKAAKQATKNIKRDWVTTTTESISKIPIKEGKIEDVLSNSDYAKCVIGEKPKKVATKNSEVAKKKKRDKVLDAKMFLETVNKGEFKIDQTSQQNISKLFEDLRDKLGID